MTDYRVALPTLVLNEAAASADEEALHDGFRVVLGTRSETSAYILNAGGKYDATLNTGTSVYGMGFSIDVADKTWLLTDLKLSLNDDGTIKSAGVISAVGHHLESNGISETCHLHNVILETISGDKKLHEEILNDLAANHDQLISRIKTVDETISSNLIQPPDTTP